MIMASDTATGDTMNLRTEEGASPFKKNLANVEDRLATLSERITLCNTVLKDLGDLSEILVRKSLHDVSLPPQK